jgi:alkylated DNA repair protein alkB family protein 8
MCRILKTGGLGLVTVWAQEQKLNDKESYYIKKKKSSKKDETESLLEKETTELEDETKSKIETTPLIHDYGKPFEKQDLFVTWHLKKMNEKKSRKQNTEEDVYLRFYHVFINGELEELFKNISNAKIVRSFYEQGNWCVVFEKLF